MHGTRGTQGIIFADVTKRSRYAMLAAVRTPQTIPLSNSLTHHGWPRNGCWAAGAPVRRTIWILTPRGEHGNSNRNQPLATPVSAGLPEER